ncbi:MAG: lysylphosphatidylglycerol synthase transmembrane domain-containing protein [Planctomycetota bacterium]
MADRRKRWLTVAKLVLAAGLIAWVCTMINFEDHLVLETYPKGDPRGDWIGEIERPEKGIWRFTPEAGGEALTIPGDEPQGELAGGAGSWTVALDDGSTIALPTFGDQDPEGIRAGERVVVIVQEGLPTLLQRARYEWLLVGLLAFALATLVAVARWQLLLRAQNILVPFRRAYSLTYIGYFFNNIIPGLTGGDLVKAFFVARDTDRKTGAVVSVIVDRVVGLLALALIAAVMVLLDPDDFKPVAVIIYGFLGVSALGGIVLYSRRIRRWLRLEVLFERLPAKKVLQEIDAAFFIYRNQKMALVIALLMSFVNHFGVISIYVFAGMAIGVDADIVSYFITVPVINIVTAIPLAPGGWGLGEWASVEFLELAGIGMTQAFTISLLFRLSLLVSSLPGGIFLAVSGSRVSEEEIERELSTDAPDEARPATEADASRDATA